MNLPPYQNFGETEKIKSQSTLSKNLRKFEDITGRFLFSLFDTSIMSRIVERVCKIVLFLIAAGWFSPIKCICCFLHSILKNCSINFLIKFKSESGKVKHELRVKSSNPQVTTSNTQVTSSNPRVTSSNPRVRRLKARVARLKARVGTLKARVERLKARVRRLKSRVEAIKPRVR